MRSFRDLNPYAVGIASMLVLGLLTGVGFAVGLLHLLENAYEMRGAFTDAAGLRGGDDVRVAGVKVGRVTGISADRRNGRVIIEWVVNHGVEVRDGATAEITTESLLGGKYLRIGHALRGRRVMEDLANDERFIPLEDNTYGQRTRTPVDVLDFFRQATDAIEQTNTGELNQLITSVADIADDKQQQVADLAVGLDRLSRAITERDVELRQLLERADGLSATLAEKDQTLVQLIDSSRTILDLIASRRDELATALGEGGSVVGQLDRLIEGRKAELDSILSTLHPTLATVQGHLPDLNRSLAWLGPGFLQQSLAGSHGPWLDIFVRALGPDVADVLCDALPQPDPERPCPA